MKRLIVIRHGQSESNAQGIIQGRTVNSELTDAGRNDIQEAVSQNIQELSEAEKIVSSPYKRTIETSEIISNRIGIPIFANEKIVEFNPGILAGKTHEESANLHPEYYKIWLRRKDLDGIPGAETGKELQARVLSFLMEYYNKEEFVDIVVSHAGFLRCLINTSKGIDRTTSVNSTNGAINIIDDPFKFLRIEHKDRAMASKVFIVETFEDKYVVKLKNRGILPEDYEEKRILDQISKKLVSVPAILSLSGTSENTTKVLKFVNGNSIFGNLDDGSVEALIKSFSDMVDALSKIETEVYKPINIYEEINELEKNAKHKYVKAYARNILSDEINKQKLESSKYSLTHNDLNRDNILFEKCENGETKANIIDWESLCMYPCDYQLASFLVSAFLIEGYSIEKVMKIAKQIEPSVDEDFIKYLMKFRLFKGLYFFVESQNEYTKGNQNISNEILKKYFFAIENLERNGSRLNLQRMTRLNSISINESR